MPTPLIIKSCAVCPYCKVGAGLTPLMPCCTYDDEEVKALTDWFIETGIPKHCKMAEDWNKLRSK